ncbi:MAG: cyclic nucleotide-binding domain-containing protein [Myxococcota bacterium]|nr:cyclic nucleotide-binding domain-containing protein [Myxococcota bacterium]
MSVLHDVLATAPLFSSFVEDELMALASAMRERRYKTDEVLFRQGQQGDAMVLVVQGKLAILGEDPGGKTVELAQIGVGDIVGEMSALDPAPRSATVKAACDATVYILDRSMLGALMHNAVSLYGALLQGIGKTVTRRLDKTNKSIREEAFGGLAVLDGPTHPPEEASGRRVHDHVVPPELKSLEGFTPEERARLLQATPTVAFDDGDILCGQGRPGHTCFLIADGLVEVIRHAGQQEHRLATLTGGTFVGQLALLHDTPRSATLRAKGPVRVVAIGRGSFRRLLRTHDSLGLKLHGQVIVAGIRQLRLASRMLTELTVAEDTDQVRAHAPAPEPPEHAASRPESTEPESESPSPSRSWNVVAKMRETVAKLSGAVSSAANRTPPPAAQRARRARQAWRAVDGGSQHRPAREDGPKRTPTREMALYVTTALEEWGMSLSDLDEVEITVPEGQMSASELKVRKG